MMGCEEEEEDDIVAVADKLVPIRSNRTYIYISKRSLQLHVTKEANFERRAMFRGPDDAMLTEVCRGSLTLSHSHSSFMGQS